MKKGIFGCIAILFLTINAVALSTDLKPEYSQAETIIVKFTGKITEQITQSQVKFIRAGHVQEVPVEYEIKRLGDNYYLWAVAPKEKGNYTLMINNVFALEKGVPKEIDFQQNFSVGDNLKQYTIKPGVILSDRDFNIKIISYQDENLKITTDFPESMELNIEPGENIINFSTRKVSGASIITIKIGDYSVPAYLIGDFTKIQESNPLKFEPSKVKASYKTKDDVIINFSIINNGEDKIKDIEIKYPSGVFGLEPEAKTSLEKNERVYYNLTLKKNDGIAIREIIYAKSDKLETALPISIDFENENTNGNEDIDPDEPTLYRCAELGGKICKGEEVCSGTKNTSLEGLCCTGTCTIESNGNSNNQLIGYILAVIVVGVLGYLYWRYRKTKVQTDLMPRKIKEAEKKHP